MLIVTTILQFTRFIKLASKIQKYFLMDINSYSCKYWYEFVTMDDDKLIKCCTVNQVRGSGSGGQKRNKTSNRVQIKFYHLMSVYEGSRSLVLNKKMALRSLKFKISLDVIPSYDLRPSPNYNQILKDNYKFANVPKNTSQNYAVFCGVLIDSFIISQGNWAKLASSIGVSNSTLTSWFKDNHLVKIALSKLKLSFTNP